LSIRNPSWPGRLLAREFPLAIETEEENDRALARVAELLAKGDARTPEEIALSRLLVVLIEAFETVKYSREQAAPHEILAELMRRPRLLLTASGTSLPWRNRIRVGPESAPRASRLGLEACEFAVVVGVPAVPPGQTASYELLPKVSTVVSCHTGDHAPVAVRVDRIDANRAPGNKIGRRALCNPAVRIAVFRRVDAV